MGRPCALSLVLSILLAAGSVDVVCSLALRSGATGTGRPSPSRRPPPPSTRSVSPPSRSPGRHTASTRRRWLSSLVGGAAALAVTSIDPAAAARAAEEVDVLPSELRRYTALAPLGPSSASPPGSKTKGVPLTDLARTLTRDLTEGSTGQGGYFVTGDLTPSVFRDDCLFVDPTNSVSSLSRYRKALGILFDPNESSVEVIEPLVVDESARTIKGRVRGRGVLQLPWRPRIASFENDITYFVDEDGLVKEQRQVWDTSASEALGQTFTPGALAPPFSSIPKPADEPPEATELFEMINGHRPDSFSPASRRRIDALVESLAEIRYPWKREILPGKWALAYLQPGPDGSGVDRRVPFPEFWFNDSYQIFGRDSVVNVGQLLGPLLEVRVSGSLRENDPESTNVPKRFVASIEGGGLCLGGRIGAPCTPLPIQGEGLFDGVYLGERIRIGQNLNGGGARVVQVKIE